MKPIDAESLSELLSLQRHNGVVSSEGKKINDEDGEAGIRTILEVLHFLLKD